MDLSHLNLLPEWKDRLAKEDEDEAWKLQAAEAAYTQWREVFGLVMAFAEILPEEEEEGLGTKSMIYQNASVVAPKIISASGDTLYQIKMENAALIRFNCRQLWEQSAFATLKGEADVAYKIPIEEALAKFKKLFRNWVATFKRDDYEDEWGLF